MNEAVAQLRTGEERPEFLEQRAASVLPASIFAYFAGGAGDQSARDEAALSWARFRFRPHVLRDVNTADLACELFDQSLEHPVIVAPTAWHGLICPEGEVATAHGAAKANAVMIVSSRASRRIEDIAAATHHWWLQVYMTRQRRLTEGLVRRAVNAGASALVLTGDTPYVGRKIHGRPAGLDDQSAITNFADHLHPDEDPIFAAEQDPSVTLEAIAWLHEISGLPVLVKGILRPDDAVACISAGADGLIVSNHGGRQIGRAVATADVLASVVDAAGATPVLVDGGLRRGEDALAALALGARAVLLGRPVTWGLAVGGSAGVRNVISNLVEDLRFNLQLLGLTSPSQLTRDHVSAACVNPVPSIAGRPT